MYPLVVADTTFLRDPEVGHKNVNVKVEVIGLRCVLTQDVKGMPYAMLMLLGIIVDESIRVGIQI